MAIPGNVEGMVLNHYRYQHLPWSKSQQQTQQANYDGFLLERNVVRIIPLVSCSFGWLQEIFQQKLTSAQAGDSCGWGVGEGEVIEH